MPSAFRHAFVALSAVVAITGALPAQVKDAGARVERLADGVYAIIHEDATDDWPHGNTGVIVGDDGVLVVDATYFPSRARADIALIRQLTDKPVRYLVNTHWHGDHTHGNGVYRELFPGMVIVGQRDNRRYIALNQARWPKNATAPNSTTRKALAALESELQTGRDSTGHALSGAEKKKIAFDVERRREELEQLAKVAVAPPELLFDDELVLTMGRRRVELRNRGRANSPADVTVYLPAELVLFTGDIVVHPVPYAWQSHPVAWIDVLRQLEAVPITALVPGHGPVLHDHRYTAQVRTLLEAATSRVDSLLRLGKTLDQVQSEVTLDDLRNRFVTRDDPSTGVVWDSSIKQALVERSYACVVGYRC